MRYYYYYYRSENVWKKLCVNALCLFLVISTLQCTCSYSRLNKCGKRTEILLNFTLPKELWAFYIFCK